LTFLRFTGLRVGETMLLRWADLDLERGLLTIEPGITKNKRGRIVPVSPHLVEHLSCWQRATAWMIPSPPRGTDRARQPRAKEVAAAWQRAGVPERVWLGSPHHASRRGFKSGLLRAGAPPDAVDHLQGHVIGGRRGRYIDPMIAYDFVEVVGRVPPTDPALHRSSYGSSGGSKAAQSTNLDTNSSNDGAKVRETRSSST
jgi:integrase